MNMLVGFKIVSFGGSCEDRCYEITTTPNGCIVATDVDAKCFVGQWPTEDGLWSFIKDYMRGTCIVVVE